MSIRPLRVQIRRFSLLLLTLLVLSTGCDNDAWESIEAILDDGPELPEPIDRDWEEIQQRDTLHVLTTYNSTSYFLYRGQAMGYEYELLQRFADDHDLAVQMHVVPSRDSIYVLLNEGQGDVVADRVVPLVADTAHIAFTKPLYTTRPVLVQRRYPGEESDLPAELDTVVTPGPKEPEGSPARRVQLAARLIRSPQQLDGEQVTLPEQSPYGALLVEISDSLTGDIEVVELDTVVSDESTIRMVSRGDIELTVAPENLAQLKQSYFTNIYVRPVLAEPHRVAWAVRTNADDLQETLNAWIEEHQGSALFNRLYEKYFVDRRGYRERLDSEYLAGETGSISPYDDLLRTYAEEVGWDWRLLAAQTFQESRFNPRARSWAGAQGLLQLMPRTAAGFGVSNAYDPDQNVAGAVRFIEWLQNFWEKKIEDPDERLKFILASYNTGQGHVQDAQRLTKKYGGDPTKWEDVAYWLLQKSKRKYYQDPVVKYGFARGIEPVLYVEHILDRFAHYRQFVIS